MQEPIDTLVRLGIGQRVRLAFDGADRLVVQVNQNEYAPDDCLRLELTSDDDGDADRYRLEAHVEGDDWTHPTVERYHWDDRAWTTLPRLAAVTPLETYRTMKSNDMEAQEATGMEAGATDERDLEPRGRGGDATARTAKLSQLAPVLAGFDYPCTQEAAVDRGRAVTLQLADGTEDLGALVDRSDAVTFDTMDQLLNEVMNLLPRHAVGEPYQSEGEG